MIRSLFSAAPDWDPWSSILGRAVAERWDLRHLERQYILAVLRYTQGHRGHAAQFLGIDRRTLYRKIREMERETAMN